MGQEIKHLLLAAGTQVKSGDIYTIAGDDELRLAQPYDHKFREELRYHLYTLSKERLTLGSVAFDINRNTFRSVTHAFLDKLREKYNDQAPHWFKVEGVSDPSGTETFKPARINALTHDEINALINCKKLNDFVLISTIALHFSLENI